MSSVDDFTRNDRDEQGESLYSLYRRGMALLEDGDFAEATVPLKEAARQAPEKSSVREALALLGGDSVVFRVVGDRAPLARTPDLLDLAGSISVPAAVRGGAWADVRAESRRRRMAARHDRNP